MSRQALTLGGLIKAVAKLPAGMPFNGCEGVCSYRGNYTDIALCDEPYHPSEIVRKHDGTVGGFLAVLIGTLSTELEGYKGGLYLMTEDSEVYVAYTPDADDCPHLVDVEVVTSAVTNETSIRLVTPG